MLYSELHLFRFLGQLFGKKTRKLFHFFPFILCRNIFVDVEYISMFLMTYYMSI